MTARIHSSNAFKSSPRKNTPAALISSSMPQYFSRGLCRTISIGVPALITELLHEGADFFSDVARSLQSRASDVARSLQSLDFRNNRRTDHDRVGVTMHVLHLLQIRNTKTNPDRQGGKLP